MKISINILFASLEIELGVKFTLNEYYDPNFKITDSDILIFVIKKDIIIRYILIAWYFIMVLAGSFGIGYILIRYSLAWYIFYIVIAGCLGIGYIVFLYI
jgi:hypothetical protein